MDELDADDLLTEEECDPNGDLLWADAFGLISREINIPVGVWRFP